MNSIITIVFCIISLITLAQIPSTGLVSYYPFTTNADDQSGNNFDGMVNGASLTNDRYSYADRAYDFNGTTDNISIPHDPALKPDFPFTISLWFKIDEFGATSSVIYASDEGNSVYSGFWIGYLPSGTISAGYGDGQGLGGGNRITKVSNTIIDTSAWHNVVAVYIGLNDIDLYIDCQLDPGSYSGSGTNMSSGTNNSVIGRSLGHSATSYHNGKIDDIRLYNIAVDSEGITALCSEDPYLSIEEVSATEIDIYPNPTSSYVNVDFGDTEYFNNSISIYDLSGRLIHSEVVESSLSAIPTFEWKQKGVYFLNIKNSEGKLIKAEKIILN